MSEYCLFLMHSDNMISIVQKYPQVLFPEGIFIKDKKNRSLWPIGMLLWCGFLFSPKKILHNPNPEEPFEKH